MDTSIRRHPLAEQAAEILLARIATEEWALGHKIPGETTLATQLGVGRSTVREAIRELAGRGVLESRQGAGVFVLSTDASEGWETVLRRAAIVDVIEARIAIEAEAARLAAERRTPSDLRALRSLLEARADEAQKGGDDAYIDADMAFHQAVINASHNAVLSELFAEFVPRIRRAMIEMLRIDVLHNHRGDTDAHAELVEAIRGRKPNDAAASTRKHLAEIRRGLTS